MCVYKRTKKDYISYKSVEKQSRFCHKKKNKQKHKVQKRSVLSKIDHSFNFSLRNAANELSCYQEHQ